MRLHIIRHADPDYPNHTITAAGREEARALARRLAGQGLDRIFCSPLPRARETAQPTSDLLKLEAETMEWTQEISEFVIDKVPWGRLMAWDIPGEIIRAEDPFPSHADWHRIPPLDQPLFRERFDHIKKESDAFLEGLGFKREGGRYRILKPGNRERVAVFCHGGFGLTWLAHLLEIPLLMVWSGFWLPPSSVTTVLFDERSPEWAVPRCLGVGDVSHLYAERLPVQPRGIKANFA